LIGVHLSGLYGSRFEPRRLEVDNVLAAVAYRMVQPGDSDLHIDDERFETAWRDTLDELDRTVAEAVVAACRTSQLRAARSTYPTDLDSAH